MSVYITFVLVQERGERLRLLCSYTDKNTGLLLQQRSDSWVKPAVSEASRLDIW
jgi:hypothetical protein